MTKRKDPKDLLKTGRPTKYTPELGQEICVAIATMPYSLHKICDLHDNFPDVANVMRWTHIVPTFRALYLEAKRLQIHTKMEYSHTLYENSTKETDSSLLNGQVNLYKWEAARLLPRLYGDTTYVEDKEKVMQTLDELGKMVAKHSEAQKDS
ncbi:MAG: terminase small subunit [Caudoviricetes sp.]|nr:MAG: terminase small subunit [Caudoviricetes sp.]